MGEKKKEARNFRLLTVYVCEGILKSMVWQKGEYGVPTSARCTIASYIRLLQSGAGSSIRAAKETLAVGPSLAVDWNGVLPPLGDRNGLDSS